MPQLTTFRLYLLGLALLFGGYVAVEYHRPKPLNWAPTFINKDKIPYGTYALFDQLPRLLGTDSIDVVRESVYTQLTGLSADDLPVPAAPSNSDSAHTLPAKTDFSPHAPAQDTRLPLRPQRANYLFINDNLALDETDALALLRFAASGNDVFIAAQDLSSAGGLLRDSLGVDTQDLDRPTHAGPQGLPVPDSATLRFTNPALAGGRYRLPGLAVAQRIVVDSGRVGQTLATDEQAHAVFVRLAYGRGHFYLCTVPLAFTNYFVLRPHTTGFAAGALAYLPARHTYWDEYQKQGPMGEQSLLRVVLAHEPLRVAYYLSLAGALLFMLIEARRRQRIIPIVKPLPNTTLLFTRTVAGLYRQGRSHGLIAEKKVSLFLDYLRIHFQEPAPDLGDEAFRERLAQKAGLPRPRVDELLRLVNSARNAPQITDRELLTLSRAMSDFRREARR